MCVTIVRFTPKEKMAKGEYASFLREVMPVYENAIGLRRKYFLVSEQGSAGFYEWESEKHAKNFYNEDWQRQMAKVAGDSVSLEYLDINAILDNVSENVDYRI